MNATPSVSCIIPVWNGEAYLQAALDSIYAQTCPVAEILIVDDGSSDGSAAVATRNGARVRLLQQPRSGAATARNRGMAEARGDLIAFLDADDLWAENKLEVQIAALAGPGEVGCCFTYIDSFVEPGSGAAVPPGLSQARAGRIASTFLGKRAAIDRVGPMDESLRIRAEVEWFARFEDAGIGMVVVPESLAWRRLHDANVSRVRSDDAVDALFDLVSRRRAKPSRDV